MQDMDGTYRIVSAEKGLLDGTYSDYVNFAGGYQSPILLMCDKESGLWGVVDYNGNVVVPFEHANSWEIELPQDGSFALVCPSDSDEAYVYPYVLGEEPVEPVAVAPAAEPEPMEEPADEAGQAAGEQADTGSAVSKLLGKIRQGEKGAGRCPACQNRAIASKTGPSRQKGTGVYGAPVKVPPPCTIFSAESCTAGWFWRGRACTAGWF